MYDTKLKTSIIKTYYDLLNYNIKGNNRKNFIMNNFEIHINTLYSWLRMDDINNYKNTNNEFKNKKITNSIESSVLYYNKLNFKTLKIKKIILKNHNILLSYKDIMFIFKKNNVIKKNYKITYEIENYIIEYITKYNTKTASDIINRIFYKFKIKISKASIYSIFNKNNLSHKNTKIITNPYPIKEQIEQVKLIKSSIDNLDINNIISIDETSIELNTKPHKGWSKKGENCLIINNGSKIINKRYSLLVATSNTKIIDFTIVEKGIKQDKFIEFITKLKRKDKNNVKSYFIDNAKIHKTKKVNNYIKKNNMHFIYNAPYHSEFNPIEYVFSLLKKIISKNISKSYLDIVESMLKLKNTITPTILNNIFKHSFNKMTNFIS